MKQYEHARKCRPTWQGGEVLWADLCSAAPARSRSPVGRPGEGWLLLLFCFFGRASVGTSGGCYPLRMLRLSRFNAGLHRAADLPPVVLGHMPKLSQLPYLCPLYSAEIQTFVAVGCIGACLHKSRQPSCRSKK